jgi:hypothetical protein
MGVNLRKPPLSDDGVPVSAPTFEETEGLAPNWQGYLYTATAGATNIYDEAVTVERRIRGGWYELLDSNAVVGDYVEFAVVDKDDVLGLFALLGLTVGEDVLELRKYVRKEYVNPNVVGRQDFQGNSAFHVVGGLYLRSIYVSTGGSNVQFKVVTFSYE